MIARHPTPIRQRGAISRRGLLWAGASALLVAPLAACDVLPFGGPTRVRLAVTPGSQTLWRYLRARSDELLAPKGYEVQFTNADSEEELQQGLVQRRFDAIATLVPAVPRIVQAGTPVQFFLPIAWLREGYPLVVPNESPIRAVADLPGRRVATFPLEHPGFIYWSAFLLKHYGLRAAQVSTFQTADTLSPLLDGQVDAAFLSGSGWANLQPTGRFRKIVDLQEEFRWLSGADRLVVFAGFVARTEWIRENQRIVADLTAAARQGLDHYKTDRDQFLDIVTAEPTWTNQMTRSENAVLASYLGYDAVQPERVYLAREDVDDYASFFALMSDADLLESAPADPGSMFYRQSQSSA